MIPLTALKAYEAAKWLASWTATFTAEVSADPRGRERERESTSELLAHYRVIHESSFLARRAHIIYVRHLSLILIMPVRRQRRFACKLAGHWHKHRLIHKGSMSVLQDQLVDGSLSSGFLAPGWQPKPAKRDSCQAVQRADNSLETH